MIQHPSVPSRPKPAARFISLRWRFVFPLALVVLLTAMLGAYALAANVSGGFSVAEDNVLLQSSQSVVGRSAELYERQHAEAQRIAYTIGVPEAIRAGQSEALHGMLEGLAAAANLDSVIVTDATGMELTGLLRVETADFTDYSVSTNTNLSDAPPVRAVLTNQQITASGLIRTFEGVLLYTAVPIQMDNQLVGIALVGQRLDSVAEALRASAVANITLYDDQGAVMQTTFPTEQTSLSDLRLDSAIISQLSASDQPIKTAFSLGSTPYRAVYLPFVFGEDQPALIGVALPDNIPFATAVGRQISALFASGLAGAVVIAGFVGISLTVNRVDRVTTTAQALAQGKLDSRTRMKPVDEVGKMGATLDVLADAMQEREDKFQTLLRRERRERTYLLSVLESLPDGVVVQDNNGRIIVMNDKARGLLGNDAVYQNAHIQEFDRLVTNVLGEALAPGIYAMGDPRQIQHNGKMLRAQAAGIVSAGNQRLGTVVLVRDMTSEVQQHQAREHLLSQLSSDIQQPLAGLAQQGAFSPSNLVNEFAREISRHAATLQKMIVDMRELTSYNSTNARKGMRPIAVETLVWAVANDWRQIAQAANLKLQIEMDKQNLYLLGEEGRLRWALGNIVDNAIKYTLPGGIVSIEIKDEVKGAVHLRVRDNGVGISDDDMRHLFMPFYRGTPTTQDGHVVHVPGMGQGLPHAQQIIGAHGGVLKVKSRLGVGTAIYIALPLTAAVGFQLPIMDDSGDGATVMLPANVDFEAIWRKS
jgi:signal transduction histidine kinase